jgi:hypothetical protein
MKEKPMRKIFSAIAIFLTVAIVACQGPKTEPSPLPPPIPKNSATMISPEKPVYQMGRDAFEALKKYLLAKHQCESFSIEKAEAANTDKELFVDGYGRLLKGTVSEKWTLMLCGKQHMLGILLTPDGKGGTYVVIVELGS